MNLIKVVVDAGYHIRESDMMEILSMVELTQDVSTMSLIIGSNQKAIRTISEDVVAFFKLVMQEFGFSTDLVGFIEQQKM